MLNVIMMSAVGPWMAPALSTIQDNIRWELLVVFYILVYNTVVQINTVKMFYNTCSSRILYFPQKIEWYDFKGFSKEMR